jgi:hypothetical protein
LIEQPNCTFNSCWAQVHVPLRRREIHVAGEILNRSRRRTAHREVRTERVPQSMHAALRELRTSD